MLVCFRNLLNIWILEGKLQLEGSLVLGISILQDGLLGTIFSFIEIKLVLKDHVNQYTIIILYFLQAIIYLLGSKTARVVSCLGFMAVL